MVLPAQWNNVIRYIITASPPRFYMSGIRSSAAHKTWLLSNLPQQVWVLYSFGL